MTFENERVPRIEDETSDYFRLARAKLRAGFVPSDQWTVDRSRNLALRRTGAGHDIESRDEEYWTFLDGARAHHFATTLLASRETPDGSVHLERSIQFLLAPGEAPPGDSTLRQIKEALMAYGVYGVLVNNRTELILRNARGEVI